MNLPKKDKDGYPYISYSQVKAWNEAKGFNTGGLGRHEFIRSYFFNEQFEDNNGFGLFGSQVEDYICGKPEVQHLFTAAEKATMDKIVALGVFQQEIRIPFKEGFYLKGFVDDCTPDFSKVRDYKTASEKSKLQYTLPDYKQLDIYALGIKSLTGKLPKELEVCAIERLGNGFRGGRNVMTVGENIWYIKRETSKERLADIKATIVKTAQEIAQYYSIFQKLNK